MDNIRQREWISADDWMFDIEQSENITPKMKRQHVLLDEYKRKIDNIEMKKSEDSFKGNGVRYIYNKPMHTKRFRNAIKKLKNE